MESEEKYGKVYHALFKRCSDIEEFNERLSYRLLQSKRVLNRLRRQRQFLVKRLHEYHDKYDDVSVLLEERKKHIERLLGHRGDIVDITDGTTSEEEVDRKVKRGHHKFADHLSGKNIIKKYKLKGFAKQEKERDPNAPKKPANAFFHFCQENRNLYQDAQKEGDSSGHHDLTKFLGSKWNSLETSDKKVYYEMYERDKKRYEEELKVYNNKKADGEAAESTMLSPDSKENAGNASKIKEEEIMYDIEDSKAEFQSLSNDDQDTKMEISMNDNSEHTSYNGDDTNNLNIDSEDDYNTTNDIDNDYQLLVDNDGDLESEQLDDNCDMMEDDDQNDS